MGTKSIGLHVPRLLRDMSETAITFLYPAECRVCKEFLGATSMPYICNNCWQDIDFLEPPWCDICGTPGVDGLCDECAISPPRYGKLRSVAFYQTTLQQAIHFFKFEKKKVLARHLIQLIGAHIPVDCPPALRNMTLFYLSQFTRNGCGNVASIRQRYLLTGLRKLKAFQFSQIH